MNILKDHVVCSAEITPTKLAVSYRQKTKMRCNECKHVVDRDINASKNIFDKGVWFALDGFINITDHIMEHLNSRYCRYEVVNMGAWLRISSR